MRHSIRRPSTSIQTTIANLLSGPPRPERRHRLFESISHRLQVGWSSRVTKILLALSLVAASAGAISVVARSAEMPLTLLLQRLGKQLAARPNSYIVHSGLAKTHATAAAWAMTSGDRVRAGGFLTELEPQFWCEQCAHVTYRTLPPPTHEQPGAEVGEEWLKPGAANPRRRAFHLDKAIEHYREAVRLGEIEVGRPNSNGPSERLDVTEIDVQRQRLGLAWNLIQRDTEDARAEARAILRAIVAEEAPKGHDPSSAPFPPIASEAIDYLLPLLGKSRGASNPDATAVVEEIQRLKRLHEELGHAIHWISPLALDLDDLRTRSASADEHTGVRRPMIEPDAQAVPFALDRRGVRRWTWPRTGVAWLVWIGSRRDEVTSGAQMFGYSTFGLSHRDGFEALCMLDGTGDGVVEGDELQGIALWHDADRSGASDPTEMMSLESVGIAGLRCDARRVDSGRGGNGAHLLIEGGVLLASGDEAQLWDLFLEDRTGDGATAPCPRALQHGIFASATR